VSDGTSTMILEEEFITLYKGEELKPQTLRIQYKDFSLWQNRRLKNREFRSQWNYWLELYGDTSEIPHLELPTDHQRPEVFTFAGDMCRFKLETEDSTGFRSLATRSGGTLYMNLLAALNTLFYVYTGQVDIIIGSGVAGRPHADLQSIAGMFVNTLAMRNYPEGEKTYHSFLKEVINQSINAFENQDIQFEELVERLNVQRDLSRNPIFDVNMMVQNFSRPLEGEAIPLIDDTRL
ncbi:MAG: hypothetical protein GY940_14420, partial [bacterium]|nr:hypothetical protein [bacterium]